MTSKIAYLTIDDAPSPNMRAKVDFLTQNNIPAIFFCIGEFMEQRPEQVIYAIQKGFIIGNHTYDHPHSSETDLDELLAQITKTDAIIDDLYQQAGVERPVKYFRFPYGDKGALTGDYVETPLSEAGLQRKQTIQRYLRNLGYTQPEFPNITYKYYRELGLLEDVDWYWTFDTLDWSVFSDTPIHGVTSLQAVYGRIDEDLPEEGRGLNYPDSEEIILIHDQVNPQPLFVPIVQRLVEKGLQFQLP